MNEKELNIMDSSLKAQQIYTENVSKLANILAIS